MKTVIYPIAKDMKPAQPMKRVLRARYLFLPILLLLACLISRGAIITTPVFAQSPPSETPQLKRLFNDETRATIKSNAEDAKSKGWRKDNTGHYFSTVKLALLLVTFWLWVATTSWANNDAERLSDPDRQKWNTILFSLFPATFFPCLLIPTFWVGFPITFFAYLVPAICYVKHRNAPLLDADKVMTFEHLTYLFKRMIGMKVESKKLAYEVGPPIKLAASGKKVDEQTKNARTILARNMPGFNQFREILYNSLKRNATSIVLGFEADTIRIQYQIDGVWHPIEGIFKRPLTLEDGDNIREAVKTLVGANPEDLKSRQFGQFQIEYDKKIKVEAELISQGTRQGEQFAIRYILKKIPYTTLDQIGMYPDRQEKFKQLLNAEQGVIVISALNGQGLKTLTNVAFTVADRFTRDFSTVEDKQNPYSEIENVTLFTYDSAKGQKPIDILPDVFFKEPKVVLLRDLGSTEALTLCCQEVANDRVIITTFRGKDSVDTLIKLLATGIDNKLLAKTLSAIVTQKLVRLLCETCKEEIPANSQVLHRLGLKQGSIESLYRKRVRPESETGQKEPYTPCKICQEIGYLGRTAIFDFLEITDEIREVIANDPTEASIRQAVLKSGQRGYLVDGARLVAEGLTSFEELARILK